MKLRLPGGSPSDILGILRNFLENKYVLLPKLWGGTLGNALNLVNSKNKFKRLLFITVVEICPTAIYMEQKEFLIGPVVCVVWPREEEMGVKKSWTKFY